MKNEFIVLSITGLFLLGFFNPTAWIQSVTNIISEVIPVHITTTLADQLENARYLPANNTAVREFNEMIKIGEPVMTRVSGPRWINENVYVALVDNNMNILNDYQVKIVNGTVVCYGKTKKVGGTADCGKPTVWVKVTKNAVNKVYSVKTVDEGINTVEDLFFSGDIDVYPKTVAFRYLGRAREILDYVRSQKF